MYMYMYIYIAAIKISTPTDLATSLEANRSGRFPSFQQGRAVVDNPNEARSPS